MELIRHGPLESEELKLVRRIPRLGWAQASARIRNDPFHPIWTCTTPHQAPFLRHQSAAERADCSPDSLALEHLSALFLKIEKPPRIQQSTKWLVRAWAFLGPSFLLSRVTRGKAV